MISGLLLFALGLQCPDANVAEYELEYEVAIELYEACLDTATQDLDRAPVLLRIGVLHFELGNESAARLVFRAALGYDAKARPLDNVSPKTRAIFDDVLNQVGSPPKPEPVPPLDDEIDELDWVPWATLGGGAAALVAGGALYALYYSGSRPPDPTTESQREFSARATRFGEARVFYETAYWGSVGLALAGVGLAGAGIWALAE